MPTLLINAAVSIAIMLAAVNVPASWLDLSKYFSHPNFSGTFTTLTGSNTLSTFPTTYNANLVLTPNLTTANTFTTGLQIFPQASTSQLSSQVAYFGGSATSSFSATGALTLITPLLVSSGGTGSTTLSTGQVLLGNGTGNIGVVAGYGASGTFLTSNGAGVAPTWQTAAIDQTASYSWTGNHNFAGTYMGVKNLTASSTAANPITLNTLAYNTPSIRAASSTVLMEDGSGGLTWNKESWQLLNSTTSAIALNKFTSNFSAFTHIRVVGFVASESNTASNLNVNFNADFGSNYGYKAIRDATVGANGSAQGGIAIWDGAGVVGTTSPTFFTMDIYNITATRKFVTFQSNTQNSGTNAPVNTVGSGVWNNTAAQITSITINPDSGSTMGSGSWMNVYGSNN